MSIDRRRYDQLVPPRSWPREESLRRPLHSPLKSEQYYTNPSISPYSVDNASTSSKTSSSSRLEITPQPSGGVDLTSDYQSSKSGSLLVAKSKKQRPTQFDYSRGVRSDVSLMPPIRQTASIFKQPVTVHRTQKEGKVKSDFKHGNQDKPKQLFWEKRLEGLRACDIDGRELMVMELPRSLKTIGAHIASETILQSVATALHISNQPVTGQTSSRSSIEKNPGIYINPEQPLVQSLSIGDEDIKRQEERVFLARKKLQEALAAR